MECFELRFWFNLPVFHTNYISNCSLSSRLFTYQVFSGVSLKTLASSRSKMYREPMKWRQYRRKWGKFGLLNLLNKDGDLSFLLYFSTKTLVKNMKRKFKKDCSMTFLSKESP